MQNSTFRYYQLKVSAKRLPGRGFRLDPLAVVFTADASGQWAEIGRTEKRLNEWNPKFSETVLLPADNDMQRRAPIRVDFYNKDMHSSRFLGTCETSLADLITTDGQDKEFELNVASGKSASGCKVYLTALEGYKTESESGTVTISLQLAQTNYYGVSMNIYYEISRAANQQWYSVFKSENTPIDEQGWGQFPVSKIAVRDLTSDEMSTALLFSLYRHRKLGPKKLLGRFQTSLTELLRMKEGEFIMFSGNAKEDLTSADVQVAHARKSGTDYHVSFKLVNVMWKAPMLMDPGEKKH